MVRGISTDVFQIVRSAPKAQLFIFWLFPIDVYSCSLSFLAERSQCPHPVNSFATRCSSRKVFAGLTLFLPNEHNCVQVLAHFFFWLPSFDGVCITFGIHPFRMDAGKWMQGKSINAFQKHSWWIASVPNPECQNAQIERKYMEGIRWHGWCMVEIYGGTTCLSQYYITIYNNDLLKELLNC